MDLASNSDATCPSLLLARHVQSILPGRSEPFLRELNGEQVAVLLMDTQARALACSGLVKKMWHFKSLFEFMYYP